MKRLLLACDSRNRTIEPDEVWLILIPIFGVYWNFVVVSKISKTLDNEFATSGNPSSGNNGKGIGFAACILFSLGLIPIVNMLVAIPAVICWIVYWVRMVKARERVLASRSYNGPG